MSLPRHHCLLIIIILLGFGLRAHDLQGVSLRGDEAFSVLYWADTPLKVSLTEIAHGEPHTPLVYAVGRAWYYLIGGIDSVFALRLLSVLGNTIGIAAMFALGLRLSRRRDAAIFAAMMWALHPFEIWHSQEFRNYAYWAGLSVTSLWLGLRLIDRPRRVGWYLYALIGGLAALTIYTESFTTIALAAIALITRGRDRNFLRRLLLVQLCMGVLLVAGLWLLQVQQGFIDNYPGLVQSFEITDYFSRFVPFLTLGSTIPLDQSAVGIGLSIACAVCALVLYRQSAREFRFVIVAALLPLILLGVVSQRYNLFHPRYVLSAAPAFILLLVLGSSHVASYLQRFVNAPNWLLSLPLLLPWFALAIITVDAHFNNVDFRRAPAWDKLGAFLNPRVNDDDLVIQLAVDPAFGYYFDGPAQDIGLPVKPYQAAEDIEAALRTYSIQFESIYVVAREQEGWPNAGVVEAWMRENMQEVLLTDASGLPIRQYMSWQIDRREAVVWARFGEAVALLDGDYCPDLLPTGELLIRLNWQPLSRTAESLKTFVHAYGASDASSGAALWTQADQYPQGGRLDSLNWSADDVFRDVYYLPTHGLIDGTYEIRVGWYDPSNGQRLSLEDGSDSIALCSVELGNST